MNEDIPVEALLKYIVKERDKYKQKLETLIPYTKGLEARLADNDKKHEETVTKMERQFERKCREYEELYKEVVTMRRDYKESAWYRDLHEESRKLREKIKQQNIVNNRLLCQIQALKLQQNDKGESS